MDRILPPLASTERRRPAERAALEAWLADAPNVTRAALAATELPPALTTVIHDVDAVMLEVFDVATGTDRHTDTAHLFERAVARLRVMWMPGPRRHHLPQVAAPLPIAGSAVKKPMETRFLR